jgi:hypothetical protein
MTGSIASAGCPAAAGSTFAAAVGSTVAAAAVADFVAFPA